MYRAQFIGAPSCIGLDPEQSFTLLAARGNHAVAAQHIMNTSALRAFLWSFVLALWERTWLHSGGLSAMLMDDLQDFLDPANVENLAASIPAMLDIGINPLLASNDFRFISSVEAYIHRHLPTPTRARRVFVSSRRYPARNAPPALFRLSTKSGSAVGSGGTLTRTIPS
jgi:hypothetical protein